jgi:hypothetical protein
MLLEEIKGIKSEKSDLRKFGITIGIVLAVFGLLLLWREREYFKYLLFLSAAFAAIGLTAPVILKPVQKAWMTLAVILGWVMTRVILSVLFYLIITSIGLVARLLGKQFLDLKTDNSQKSYWIHRKSEPFDRNRYEKQF